MKVNVEIKQGSPLHEDVEVVVNSANNWLILGSGIAGEIKEEGGPNIQSECDQIISNHGGPVEIGKAVSTGAGDLSNIKPNLKYIIHAVGMGYKTKINEGQKDRILATVESVHSAVTNSLKVAEELGVKSLAFPLMCSRPGYSNLDSKEASRIMFNVMTQAFDSYCQEKCPFSKIIICTGDLMVNEVENF